MLAQARASQERKHPPAAARQAMKPSHAPYSRFQVGVAQLNSDGGTFCGGNGEHASYGLAHGVERSGISSAVAEDLPKLTTMAVVNPIQAPFSPCGAGRQVMDEFRPEARVVLVGANDGQGMAIVELLPGGFRLP